MNIGEDSYVWNPNFIQFRDPETDRYFGNVVGNFSLEDQLKIVDDEGDRQKTDIQNAAAEQIAAIGVLSEKYRTLWAIVDQVTKDVTGLDPETRENNTQFIEDFIESYVPPVETAETDSGTEEEHVWGPSGAEFYLWQPNYIQFKDPSTGRYFGNVVGNSSLEEQLKTVSNAGQAQKDQILETGTARAEEIIGLSEKFRYVTRVNENAIKAIIAFFGGVFILNSSSLDSTPLS